MGYGGRCSGGDQAVAFGVAVARIAHRHFSASQRDFIGGFVGATFMMAIQFGAGGVFSNEVGLGSAAIAVAVAKT